MSDEGDGRAAGTPGAAPPPGARPGVAGWYPDPWSTTRRRWWTGQAWTFSTTEDARPAPPPAPAPLPVSAPSPQPPAPPSTTAKSRRLVRTRRFATAAVLGILLGLLGTRLLHHPARPTTGAGDSGTAQGPLATRPSAPPTSDPAANTDPASSALTSLIVKPADVGPGFLVTLTRGGNGLSVATLDLCNGTFPSEARRTARLQDVVVDGQVNQILSTEAVLYRDAASTAQAFSELQAVSAACPPTPVTGPTGGAPAVTRFNPRPDADWPQTPTVSRLAFDFTQFTEGGDSHSVAVYLQRGRALLGVYFAQPDGEQIAVAGQTTIPGIVGVFAARLAALPASVVGP